MTDATTIATSHVTTTGTMIKTLMSVNNMMAVQATVMAISTIPTALATSMISTTTINTTITTIVMITNVQTCRLTVLNSNLLRLWCFVDSDWLIF